MSETESPEIITCSVQYAGNHLGALLDAAAAGAAVRIIDLRRGEVRGYIRTERPAALDSMPDDLGLIQARIRRMQAGRLAKALDGRKRAAS